MQLSKLEVKGFKSFGDKIVINFDQGITGIVGPNGCGKSNVVDAIRWVLGEQKTKALRSEKMENIIFNGTKNRKPLQMAEVSLTFNNTRNLLGVTTLPTEYSQVTLTRRYYRSGESEYQLNGVTCRLKDITNLFLDTGIGSDSYAIIELKMVDDILNDKDNARRGLFEEAAGVSKFKLRKKETLRKMEDTDKDLERVEDVLFEITKNLKVLEKQAKQAQNYYKLKNEYKHWSIEFARKSVSKQRDSFVSLGRQIDAENDRKTALTAQLAQKEAELEKEKAGLITKEKLLSSRQKALNEHVNKIRQYESEKKIKHERLLFLKDKSASLQRQIEQDRENNENATHGLDDLRSEKIGVEEALLEIKAELDELKRDFEQQKDRLQELQKELNTANQAYRSRQDIVYQLRKSVEIKQMQLSALRQELEKATADTSRQTASLSEFDERLLEVSAELEEKNQALTTLRGDAEQKQGQLRELDEEMEEIRDEMAKSSRLLDARQNEYNLTKSLVDNLEGFPEAIQFLKKHESWGATIPLLSDILSCEEQYRAAVENYLESIINYYVVDTEAQALQAVSLLSQSAKGRANFFVLDQIPATQLTRSLPGLAGLVSVLDIVEVDTRYRKLIEHILHNVYIVPQAVSEEAAAVAVNGCALVTQNGQLIRQPYSVSGGSAGFLQGKRIGQTQNLERLSKEITNLTENLRQIRTRQEAIHEQKTVEATRLTQLNVQIQQVQREIGQVSQEYISIKTKQEQFAQMLSSQALRREDLQANLDDLYEAIGEEQPQAEQNQAELQNMEVQINQLNRDLMAQNELSGSKSGAYNQTNIRFHQQQNKLESLEKEISYKQRTLEESHLRLERNTAELMKAEADMNQLLEVSEVNDDELISFYEEKETLEQAVNEAEREYYASRGQIDKLEKELRETQRQREGADSLLSGLQDKLNENKMSLLATKERLSVEFNVNLDEVMDGQSEEAESLSEQEVREKVQQLKKRLDEFGPINPMAMEAYEEIKQRYDFIVEQRQDLVNAKNSLLSTISEIDAVAKETFLSAYTKIRENFIKVFRSLFSEEDTCDLSLSDPQNPLESTIEIMAKPKGKRPLTINQLSGGEKTLTATSLLFAIYLLKPAPFCIFDEVDAPLDDANIDKFNNIIRKFSDQSQFIIVTHNKRTMATTDVIYGITMIEPGVSRVVPVDLRALD